ncbi:MAG: DUF3526 domain-containing protein [Acidobacteriota bacterium]
MITRILLLDLRNMIADRTLIVVVLLFTTLIFYALYNGNNWKSKRIALIKQAQQVSDNQLNEAKKQVIEIYSGQKRAEELPQAGRPGTIKTLACLSPQPLAVLSLGQGIILPYSVSIDIYSIKYILTNQTETDNPVNLIAGRFDLSFVFIYFYPLLILVLSYNILSAEREEGTLQITLSQPVHVQTVLLGKTLARIVVLLTTGWGVTLIGLWLFNIDISDRETIIRLTLWLALILIYTFFWFSIALMVNAFGKNSAANAITLITIWLTIVIVTPVLLTIVTTKLHPLPSRLELIREIRAADNAVNREDKQLLSQYYKDHPELTVNGAALNPEEISYDVYYAKYYAMQQELQQRVMSRLIYHNQQLMRQQYIITNYRFLSPAIVMQEALNNLAGTDRQRHEQFIKQVGEFIDLWHSKFAPMVFRKERLSVVDYDKLPRFEFREEHTNEVVRRTLISFVGIGSLVLIFSIISVVCLRHYPLIN